MRPQVQLLDAEGVDQILAEGCALLSNPGIPIENQEALDLLRQAGAGVDEETQAAYIPAEGSGPGHRPRNASYP